MKGILGIIAIAALGGIVLWFMSRKSAAGGGTPSATSGGQELNMVETSPGVWEISWPTNGGAGGELLPEYVPPVTYPTQAPEGNELYQLGTPENPLYTTIPGELIPQTGPGSWYEIRKIEEVLGLTPVEYTEMIQEIRVTPPAERTVEQTYAGGYADTLQQAEAVVDFKQRVGVYGGEYVHGVLVPPATWSGTVTEFANYVRASLDRN
jgi:hypothetical protein